MVQLQTFVIAALALACVCGSAMAQLNCIQANSMPVNASALAGQWYEVQRNPASSSPLSCAKVVFSFPNAQTLNALVQYSNVAGSPQMQAQNNWTISLANVTASAGYTVTTSANTTITYKVIYQDPSNYTLICGYTNASDPSTIFGVILTSQPDYNPPTSVGVVAGVYGLPQGSWVAVNQTACVLDEPTTTSPPTTKTTTSGSSGSTGSSNSTGAPSNGTTTTPETTTHHGGASGTSAPVVLLVTSAMYALLKCLH